jgi:tetratricopeptide (TPR) repeat protein
MPTFASQVRSLVLAATVIVAASATFAQDSTDRLARGDSFLIFRDTKIDLSDGKTRDIDSGTWGKVVGIEGQTVIAMIGGAKLPVPLANVASGRSGVARLSTEIRRTPNGWSLYLYRADLRRTLKDFDAALDDLAAIPKHAPQYPSSTVYRGVIRFDQGKWQAAVDDFDTAMEFAKQARSRRAVAYIHRYRGTAHYRLDKLDEAIEDIEAAIKLGYDSAEAHLWHGRLLEKKGRTPGAFDAYKKAKELDPYDKEIRGALVQLYERLNLHDKAIAELDELTEWKADDPDVLWARARIRYKNQQHDEALADAERLLGIDPNHVGARLCQARVFFAKGDRNSLERVALRLMELKLENARDFAERGFCLNACGLTVDAMKDFDQAIALELRESAIHTCRAQIHASRANWQQAVDEASTAIKLDSRNSEAHYLRGGARVWLKQIDEAIADFDRALQIRPSFVRALHARAQTLANIGRKSEAIADLRMAFQLEPGEKEIAKPLFVGLCSLGREHEAILTVTEHMLHAGESAGWYMNRAGPWQRLGNYEMAVADTSEAIRLQPNRADLYVIRATCYVQLKKPQLALADCEHAETLSPGNSQVAYVRGLTYLECGQLDAALMDFENCVKSDERNCYGHIGIAIVRSGAEDALLRDGELALRHARRACELTNWRESRLVAYVAYSHAEMEDYANALSWLSNAIDLASPEERLVLTYQLELLEAREPIRWCPSIDSTTRADDIRRN